MKSVIEFIDMDREELNQLVERARASLSQEDYRKVKGMAEALTYLTDMVADQQTTIRDLRELMFPASTEKTKAVLEKAGVEPSSSRQVTRQAQKKPKHKSRSHPAMDETGRKPFEYLTEVQRHTEELAAHPADWMPWKYRETFVRADG